MKLNYANTKLKKCGIDNATSRSNTNNEINGFKINFLVHTYSRHITQKHKSMIEKE